MFALAYVDGGLPHVHVLRVGETLIGRTPACDLIINAPSVSRRHARLRVVGGRVFVRDADSTHGTAVNGVPVIEEQEIASGDTLLVGEVEITLIQDLPESELLSESHQVLGETGNLVRHVDDDRGVTRAAPKDLNAAGAAALAKPRSERRGGTDRRKVDLGRLTGERRTARDRRGGRIVQLLTDAEQRFMTQERDVTVMFCDIVGFTTLCEQLEPAVIGELLNSFFGRMADVIFDHEGTLDKFIGDAILAVFGAPFDQPDHATRCVAAALAMRQQLAHFNLEQPRHIRMRIAINTGRALTGDIGSPKRREFTVLGDVVNIAARLEASVAQPDQIVISDKTRERLGDAFQLRPLGVVSLRGRESNLAIFEVIG
ncbi:MAG TPA: adenylate/guanylate cyclase domain-containing protein [Vicinamibacterales bacterium]|nr:adenylate/guanylate cyclase domain-containing protein [Vicinamibacterales bacterium]